MSFDHLERPMDFIPKRQGSWDRSGGNADSRPIKPGGELVLAKLKGPGRIVHWWCTVAAEKIPLYHRDLILRIWWDDEKKPSVETPLGDFFCNGHAMQAEVRSMPITVTETGGRNCWFPMPFKKSARMTVTNDSDKPVRLFYWNIDWQKLDSLPDDTMYFHCRYRQEFPTTKGKDYCILQARGSGHFVGMCLNVEKADRPGWFGEGDEKIYIDDETHPSIWGTGTEDCFLTAWRPHVYHSPWAGYSIMQGFNHPGDKNTSYRFYILDPVPFKKSIKVVIEHAWDVKNCEFCDHYSSTAYWYQSEPHRSHPALPKRDRRRPRYPEEITYDEFWKKGNTKKGW